MAGPLLQPVTFNNHGIGQTRGSMITRAISVEDRNRLIARGFAEGLKQGMGRLAAALETLTASADDVVGR